MMYQEPKKLYEISIKMNISHLPQIQKKYFKITENKLKK